MYLVTQLISPSGKLLNSQYPFLPLHLIIEPWYHLRCLPLLHTATCIKNTRTHAKLQKVNSHENQPCGTALVTTPDQGLEPFYKLIQQDQRRRFYVWGRGLLLWTPACEGNCPNCHLHHLVNMRARTNLTLQQNTEVLDFSVILLSH